MDTISNIFAASTFKHDRYFGESFTLPYSFEQIRLQPNDLSTFRSINLAIEKLYTNFLYIYGLTKLGSSIIPDEAYSTMGATAGGLVWAPTTSPQTLFIAFSSISLSAFDTTIINEVQYSPQLNNDILVTCSTDTVIISKASRDASTVTVLLSSKLADADTHLYFRNIVGAVFHENSLYVADSAYNNIYRYDLTELLFDQVYPTNDGLILSKVIGGYGTASEKYQFNDIGGIAVVNSKVYVTDRNNYAIKIYDLNLNFLDVVQRIDLFRDNKPTGITSDENTGNIFVGTDENTVVVFNSDLKVLNVVDLSVFFRIGESINNIFSGKNISNVYYITTNYNIWKFYASKPSNPIGKYSLYRFGLPVTDLPTYASSVANSDGETDSVYVLSLRQPDNIRRIVKATDSANYADVLSVADFEVYTLDDIYVKPDEYTQTWVMNKVIQKLVANHVKLKDKLIGRFYSVPDENNNALLGGFFYFLTDDFDLTSYKLTVDHFAGNNEGFLNTVVNRGLQKIYDIQTAMITKSNTISLDSSYSEIQAVFIG